MVPIAVPPRASQRDLAQLLSIKILGLRLQIVSSAALLHPNLKHSIVEPCSSDDGFTLVDRVGERLFDIDVLTGVAGIDRYSRMPMIGRSNQDCVDFAQRQQF